MFTVENMSRNINFAVINLSYLCMYKMAAVHIDMIAVKAVYLYDSLPQLFLVEVMEKIGR